MSASFLISRLFGGCGLGRSGVDVLEDLGMDFMCWNDGFCGGYFSWVVWGFHDCGNLEKEVEFGFELCLKILCNKEMDISNNLDIMQECKLPY